MNFYFFMSKTSKKTQRHQQQRSDISEPKFENSHPPDDIKIVPQINYLRNYTLNTNGLDNISIQFENQTKKEEFDLSLLNKIWNRKETNIDYYLNHNYNYLYGTNKEGQFTNISMLFGITSFKNEDNEILMYLFIFTFSLTSNKGILRVHKVVLPSYTNYSIQINDDKSKYGVYSFSQGKQPETPLLGFYNNYFYLPN